MKRMFVILFMLATLTVTAQGKPRVNSVRFIPAASAPSTAIEGELYYNSTDKVVYLYKDGAFTLLTGATSTGEKLLSTETVDRALVLADFEPTGADEGKQKWLITQGTVNFTSPVITGTTQSLIIKPELSSTVTVRASSTQLFWIANEDQYVNAFTVDNMNAAAMTPISATLMSVDGAVQGFFEDLVAPGTVGSLADSNLQSTTVTMTWTAATDNVAVDYYEISTDGVSYTNIGNVLTYNLTGLVASTAYTVYVRAVDTSGNTGTAVTDTFTTSGSLTLLTDGNPNSDLFSNGSGSFVTDDTGLYDAGIGDHFSAVQLSAQTAELVSINGSTYVNQIVGTGSQYSRVRTRFNNVMTAGEIYEYDFIYRMTNGGEYGAVRIDGVFLHTNLNSSEWTVVSGEFTEAGTGLDVDIYVSSSGQSNVGDTMQWKMIVKQKVD